MAGADGCVRAEKAQLRRAQKQKESVSNGPNFEEDPGPPAPLLHSNQNRVVLSNRKPFYLQLEDEALILILFPCFGLFFFCFFSPYEDAFERFLFFFCYFLFFPGRVKADFLLTFKILTTAINPLQIHLRSCPRLSSKPLIFTTVPPPLADTHLYLYIYTHTHAEYSSTSEPGGNVIPLYKKKYGLAGKSL